MEGDIKADAISARFLRRSLSFFKPLFFLTHPLSLGSPFCSSPLLFACWLNVFLVEEKNKWYKLVFHSFLLEPRTIRIIDTFESPSFEKHFFSFRIYISKHDRPIFSSFVSSFVNNFRGYLSWMKDRNRRIRVMEKGRKKKNDRRDRERSVP